MVDMFYIFCFATVQHLVKKMDGNSQRYIDCHGI